MEMLTPLTRLFYAFNSRTHVDRTLAEVGSQQTTDELFSHQKGRTWLATAKRS